MTVDARQMAATPRERKQQPAERAAGELQQQPTAEQPKPNRFLKHFTAAARFSPMTGENKPLDLQGGGKQIRLSHALIPLGETGYYVPCHIVQRINGDGSRRFLLVWPSTGTKFRRSVLQTDDERAEADLRGFGSLVVDNWKTWQRARKANGETASSGYVAPGVSIPDEELAELGLSDVA